MITTHGVSSISGTFPDWRRLCDARGHGSVPRRTTAESDRTFHRGASHRVRAPAGGNYLDLGCDQGGTHGSRRKRSPRIRVCVSARCGPFHSRAKRLHRWMCIHQLRCCRRALPHPSTGTIPHALVQLFPDETDALLAVAETYNRYPVLLDTYDVANAISTVIKVAHDVEERRGHHLVAVRLHRGKLEAASRHVRSALDAANRHRTRILASGDLDEFTIEALARANAPIDGFGVGSSLGIATASASNPGGLGGVYEAVHYVEKDGTGTPLIKVAPHETTWPGRKEVYRIGSFGGDVVELEDEPPLSGSLRLLRTVVLSGSVVSGSSPPSSEVREFA